MEGNKRIPDARTIHLMAEAMSPEERRMHARRGAAATRRGRAPCPNCGRMMPPNNYKRHVAKCAGMAGT